MSRAFTEAEKNRLMLFLVGCCLGLVGVLSLIAVGYLRGWPDLTMWVLVALLTSLAALAVRALVRSMLPVREVSVPMSPWLVRRVLKDPLRLV